jgi:hypothetical protein
MACLLHGHHTQIAATGGSSRCICIPGYEGVIPLFHDRDKYSPTPVISGYCLSPWHSPIAYLDRMSRGCYARELERAAADAAAVYGAADRRSATLRNNRLLFPILNGGRGRLKMVSVVWQGQLEYQAAKGTVLSAAEALVPPVEHLGWPHRRSRAWW